MYECALHWRLHQAGVVELGEPDGGPRQGVLVQRDGEDGAVDPDRLRRVPDQAREGPDVAAVPPVPRPPPADSAGPGEEAQDVDPAEGGGGGAGLRGAPPALEDDVQQPVGDEGRLPPEDGAGQPPVALGVPGARDVGEGEPERRGWRPHRSRLWARPRPRPRARLARDHGARGVDGPLPALLHQPPQHGVVARGPARGNIPVPLGAVAVLLLPPPVRVQGRGESALAAALAARHRGPEPRPEGAAGGGPLPPPQNGPEGPVPPGRRQGRPADGEEVLQRRAQGRRRARGRGRGRGGIRARSSPALLPRRRRRRRSGTVPVAQRRGGGRIPPRDDAVRHHAADPGLGPAGPGNLEAYRPGMRQGEGGRERGRPRPRPRPRPRRRRQRTRRRTRRRQRWYCRRRRRDEGGAVPGGVGEVHRGRPGGGQPLLHGRPIRRCGRAEGVEGRGRRRSHLSPPPLPPPVLHGGCGAVSLGVRIRCGSIQGWREIGRRHGDCGYFSPDHHHHHQAQEF